MINKHNVDYTNKVLEVKNLRQYFTSGKGKRKIQVKAVDGISFDVYKREVFGLVGESGCGKTTTGRSIIKLYKPTDGKVIYKGNVIGAGYEGFVYQIKKLRREARFEILSNTPLKLKKHELKEKYKFELLEIKAQIKNEKDSLCKQRDEVSKPKEEYIFKTKELKENYINDRYELIHQATLEKGVISAEGIKPVIDEYKSVVKIVNDRFKDKVKFIKTLKLEKYEVDEQVRMVKDEYHKEIEEIEIKTEKSLTEKGVDTSVPEYGKLLKEDINAQ